MVATQQPGHALQCRTGQRPGGVRRCDGRSRQVAEHLSALVVDAEQPWRAVEPDVLEVPQQGVRGRAGRAPRPSHGVADPDHEAPVRGAPGQEDLGLVGHRLTPAPPAVWPAHASPSSVRASVACVTSPSTRPPRTAARTAGAFADTVGDRDDLGDRAHLGGVDADHPLVSRPFDRLALGVDEDTGDVGDDAVLGELLTLARAAGVVQGRLSRLPRAETHHGLGHRAEAGEGLGDLGLLAHGGRRRGVGDDERRVEEVGRATRDPRRFTHQLDRVLVARPCARGRRQLDDRRGGERLSEAAMALTARAHARPSTSSPVTISLSSSAAARPRCSRSVAGWPSGVSIDERVASARTPPAAGRTGRRRSAPGSRSRCARDRCARLSISRATLKRLSWNSSAISTFDRRPRSSAARDGGREHELGRPGELSLVHLHLLLM